jgi:hypothetical protein
MSKRWENLEKYIDQKKSSKDKNDAYSVATDIMRDRESRRGVTRGNGYA